MTEELAKSDWWRSFHVIEMADLFLDRPESQVEKTTEFLSKVLRLNEGDYVFDQCCGIGTVALNFAKKGFVTTGVDLCQIYIDRAVESVAQQNLTSEFHCADGFEFVPSKICDGVFNWYSSFGYAETDLQNKKMLTCAFESLKPGGYYALDVPNIPSLLRGFQRHLVRTGTSAGNHVTCVRDSEIDLKNGLLVQNWQWLVEGREIDQRQSSLKIYMPHRLVEMLSAVGFEGVELFGDTDRAVLSIDSARLIVVARKPFQ